MAKVIIGLGNPGKQYEKTRHNAGFMVVDALSERLGIPVNLERFCGLIGEGRVGTEKIILLKPLTYMNRSGESVRPLLDYYQIPVEQALVVYDDLDLPVGKIRLRLKGGSGGHNGIKSILAHVGSEHFKRLRIGIGRPPAGWEVADYVLSRFTSEEAPAIDQAIQRSVEAIQAWFREPFEKVMSLYNMNG